MERINSSQIVLSIFSREIVICEIPANKKYVVCKVLHIGDKRPKVLYSTHYILVKYIMSIYIIINVRKIVASTSKHELEFTVLRKWSFFLT